jgi:hypothetical protein
MPTPLTTPTLESVLQGLHESEIRCGIQNEPPAGGITAWIDYGSRTEKATFYGTIVGDWQVWPAADRIAAWLHETALRPMTRLASFASCKCGRGPSDSKHCDPFPRGLPVRQRRWQPKL